MNKKDSPERSRRLRRSENGEVCEVYDAVGVEVGVVVAGLAGHACPEPMMQKRRQVSCCYNGSYERFGVRGRPGRWGRMDFGWLMRDSGFLVC